MKKNVKTALLLTSVFFRSKYRKPDMSSLARRFCILGAGFPGYLFIFLLSAISAAAASAVRRQEGKQDHWVCGCSTNLCPLLLRARNEDKWLYPVHPRAEQSLSAQRCSHSTVGSALGAMVRKG